MRFPSERSLAAWTAIVLWLVLSAVELRAADRTVSGRVVDLDGRPVAGALVRAASGETQAETDAEGIFEIALELPAVLSIEQAGYESSRLELTADAGDLPEVVLVPRAKVHEAIAVSATRSQSGFAPPSVATSLLTADESSSQPNAVTALVAESPGVSENGQGGLFQTYSVRGVSRQRVLTLIEGMRIVSERRAGVSASFLDPLLLGSVEVVRGPSSTYWGSGALGGVVQLFPRRFDGLSISVGYGSDGNERSARLGQGFASAEGGDWSWGLAARSADRGETAAGETLNSGFDQASGVLAGSWTRGDRTYDVLALASLGSDIGKANTDFPERATTYPEEEHALVRFGVSGAGGWRLETYAHPNRLETLVVTSGVGESRVDNRALDWGASFQREQRPSGDRTVRWGADVFGRDGIRAREEALDSNGMPALVQETLAGGTEHELGLFAAIEARAGRVSLVGGGRFAMQRQSNSGFETSEDTALTAFVGAVIPVRDGYQLTANVGTGLRFPSISERFFTGTTGRGAVTGNPSLEPERSLNLDAGLRWTGSKGFVSGSLFHNRIEDYIERVETSPGQLTFRNLDSGRILGIELDGGWRLSSTLSMPFGGHWIDGEAGDASSLADIPVPSLHVGGSFDGARWSLRGRWERRFDKSDPGSGEKTIPAADLVSAALGRALGEELTIRLSARNLLDEEYFNSADRRVSPAAGRSLALTLDWNPSAAGSSRPGG